MKFGEFKFYDMRAMSRDEKVALLRDCKAAGYKWWADKLDCSVSFSRQRFECTFDEILSHLNDKAHIVVIDRGIWGDFDNKEHFEVGFRSMEDPVDFFLFIEVASDRMPPIIKKYRLEPTS
jgi:hypothetical protein